MSVAAADPGEVAAFGAALAGAAEATGSTRRHFRIAGVDLALGSDDAGVDGALWPAFAVRGVAPADRPALELFAIAGRPLPVAPTRPEAIRAKGEIDLGGSTDLVAVHSLDGPALWAFDAAARRGWAWYADRDRLPAGERAAPLLRPLRWGLAAHGVQVAHAAAIAAGGHALLLAGRGGAGKSTLSVAALLGGFEFLGDDYVAFEAASPPRVHALFATAKLDPGSVARLGGAERLGTPTPAGGDKARFALAERFAARLPASRPLAAIVLPRLGGEGARPRRVGPAAALRALAPSTLFQLPGSDSVAFRSLADLARTLPAFELDVGARPERALAALETLARETARG